MKKKVLIGIVILVIIIWFYAIYDFQKIPSYTYTVEGKHYTLLEARAQPEWEQGLMNIKTLEKADGMIFLFPDHAVRQFWNKNTYLDLEVIWMDNEKVVGKSFLPRITKSKNVVTVSSPRPVNKVVELVR